MPQPDGPEEAEELAVLDLEVDVIDRDDETALVGIDDLGHAATRGVITERLVHLRQPDLDLCHVRLVPSEARPQLSARTYPDSAGALDVGPRIGVGDPRCQTAEECSLGR